MTAFSAAVTLPFSPHTWLGANFAVRGFDRDLHSHELGAIQCFDGYFGLIIVGHVNKSKVLDDITLLNFPVLFEQITNVLVFRGLSDVPDIDLGPVNAASAHFDQSLFLRR